jgi:hypothetical protein
MRDASKQTRSLVSFAVQHLFELYKSTALTCVHGVTKELETGSVRTQDSGCDGAAVYSDSHAKICVAKVVSGLFDRDGKAHPSDETYLPCLRPISFPTI